MDPLKLLREYNNECSFTNSIKEGNYVEKVEKIEKIEKIGKITKFYTNFVYCILDNYDIILSNTPEKEKSYIFKQKVIDMLSKLEEDSIYNGFNYNEKNMTRRVIQNGLQISLKNEYIISSIYYLNDYYKTHFVIVDENKQEYYETTIKNYPKAYLALNKNKFRLEEIINTSFIQKKINDSFFVIDVKSNIYKKYLDSIGKYKVGELKTIATNFGIQLTEGNKIKTKKTLYDDINLYNLNLI